MTHKRARVEEARVETRPVTLLTSEVGWLVEGSSAASLRVDFAGNAHGPVVARTTVTLDDAAVQHAVTTRQGVLLQFERGHSDKPIITGLIQNQAAPLVELLLGAVPHGARAATKKGEPAVDPSQDGPSKKPAEAKLDGKRVVLEADNEIELRCGEASLILTREGKVLLRGAYVETRARGVNRIKGAAVKIN